MPRTKRSGGDGSSKFQRYRQAQSHEGMKPLRIWVPDPPRPKFAQEAERQGKFLSGQPEDREAMAFIEAALRGLNLEV